MTSGQCTCHAAATIGSRGRKSASWLLDAARLDTLWRESTLRPVGSTPTHLSGLDAAPHCTRRITEHAP
jgi:hypothetical protein